ncbi:MAG: hypothetical protein J6I52_00095 [Prevotella sp.]|nr:hypothetical protein [Prevotella sp.]
MRPYVICHMLPSTKQIFMILAALLVMSCSRDEIQAQTTNYETMTTKMYITIDGRTEAVTLTNNSATQALVAKLQEASVTVTLNSSGGFEIWGALGFSLPTSNEQINAQPGDIVLYNGSNICMFYGTNSWNYTLLGKIDGLSESELRTFLKAGESNISVTLSLSNTTGISQVKADGSKSRAYTLSGTLAQVGHKGIIIQNGKKIIRKQ